MRKFHLFTHSLLLVTSPSLFAYPQCESPIIQQICNQEKSFGDINFTYDEILKLIRDIEEERIEGLSEEKIDRITHFIAFLAEQGKLPEDYAANVELENDIAALFENDDNFNDHVYAAHSFVDYTIRQMVLNAKEGPISFLYKNKHIAKKDKNKRTLPTLEEIQNIRESRINDVRKKFAKAGLTEQPHNTHEKNFFTKIKDFISKHRKAIIIGAAIVVGVAIVVVAVAVAAASSSVVVAAVGAAAAGAAPTPDSSRKSDTKDQQDISSFTAVPTDLSALKSTIDDQIVSFKENLMQNQFFQPTNPSTGQQSLSWEENGRTLGSLFAHDSYQNIQHQLSPYPTFSQETQDINPYSGWNQGSVIGHSEIDRNFSTEYTHLFTNPSQDPNFNTLSHQARGEAALTFGYYDQAVQDFGRAIETNPTNPVPYLERGIAHFGLGQYEHSLKDYQQFTTQAQMTNPLSISEFSLGVAKGLPRGIYESGEGTLLFLADFVTHPIQTTAQLYHSAIALYNLAHNDQWEMIAEALSPEMKELITQWDALSSEERGELAGYAFGKFGADFCLPAAIVKIASTSMKTAQELMAIAKNMQIAQKTLILETAAEIGNSAKIAEVVETGQKMSFLADELGLTTREMGELKQAGNLETAIATKYEHLSLPMQESFALHQKAKEALEPFAKKPMPEFKVRELIHETGIPTFPRPMGIPENYLVMISDKGAGMIYVHPTNSQFRVRVMPGKPHSPNPSQQNPYVVQQTDRGILDKSGNYVLSGAPEAHIPINEFIYRNPNGN